MLGRPSPTLYTRSQATPKRFRYSCVPLVADTANPRSAKRLTNGVTVGLSASLTVTITERASSLRSPGRRLPADTCALANAMPKESSTPMASPVERISGPSSVSTSKRPNGNTASLTATPFTLGSSGTSMSASRWPAMTRAAIRASGTPVALPTNGTVRDARGFTSSTYTCPSLTAYCTFKSPTTPSSSANSRVKRRISSSWPGLSRYGGSTQAESPEWTPASSMCCMMPPITTSTPSQRASTSASKASSRKRSTSTGWSGEARTARSK